MSSPIWRVCGDDSAFSPTATDSRPTAIDHRVPTAICAGRAMFPHQLTRRMVLTRLGAGSALIALAPLRARAGDAETMSAIRDIFGGANPKAGRITLELPRLAESGNSVPVTVAVD